MRWATVTDTSPLRVKVDGDTSELPFTPDSLVDPLLLTVNDRVRCELADRRLIIVGRSGGDTSIPVGTHLAGEWTTGAVPLGFVLANGALLLIADYPKLAAHYAAVYGSANFHGGNGTTTFATPDTRERTYVNQGGSDIFATIGAKLGAKTHSLTVSEMPSHTHEIRRVSLVVGGGSIEVPSQSGNATRVNTEATGGGAAHNNVQPSFVCRYIIRAA